MGKGMQKVCYKGHMGRSKKAKPEKPVPLSNVKALLLGDLLRSPTSAGNLSDALRTWYETDDLEVLLDRLRSTSQSILSNPALALFIARLLHLFRSESDERKVGGFWSGDGWTPLQPGTCKLAGELLEQIGSAVVTGLFQESGWSVQPPTRRGRPKLSSGRIADAIYVYDGYKHVLKCLQVHQAAFKRTKGESQTQWLQRLPGLIQRVWVERSRREPGVTRLDPVSPGAVLLRHQHDRGALFDHFPFVEPPPLPKQVINACLNAAVKRKDEARPYLDFIAHSLVGYSWGLTPRQAQSYVEIAQKELRGNRTRKSSRDS